jgi:hypothetical protein
MGFCASSPSFRLAPRLSWRHSSLHGNQQPTPVKPAMNAPLSVRPLAPPGPLLASSYHRKSSLLNSLGLEYSVVGLSSASAAASFRTGATPWTGTSGYPALRLSRGPDCTRWCRFSFALVKAAGWRCLYGVISAGRPRPHTSASSIAAWLHPRYGRGSLRLLAVRIGALLNEAERAESASRAEAVAAAIRPSPTLTEPSSARGRNTPELLFTLAGRGTLVFTQHHCRPSYPAITRN